MRGRSVGKSAHQQSRARVLPLMLVAALVATTLTGAVAPAAAQDEVVPPEELAERCGLDPDLMQQADALLATNSYVVMRYGEICWQGGNQLGHAQPLPVFSVTKTFAALMVGLVATRSPLLDDTTRITEWADPADLGDVNPDATVAHVLSMAGTNEDLSSGQRVPWSYDTFGDRELHLLRDVMDGVIAADPDAFDGAANADEVAQRFIFDVLDMPNTTWDGEMHAGLEMTATELAKLGELILRRGRWGDQVLIDEGYMYRLTHPAFEDANTAYGYLTYLNADGNALYSTGTADHTCMPYVTWPDYPHAPFYEMPDHDGGTPLDWPPTHDIGVVWAAGAGGQKLAVHRGLDLVIAVRDSVISDDPSDPGTFEGHKVAWNAVRPALVAHDPVHAGDEDAFCEAYRASQHAPDLHEAWSARASGPLNPLVRMPNPAPSTATADVVQVAADAAPVERVIAFSRLLYGDGVATEALLASDEDFADALASGGLQTGRPLLLGDPAQLEAGVLDELRRLGVSSVRILGGTAAVSDAVAQDLRDAGFDVTRTAGQTRLETAAEVGALLEADRRVLTRAFGDQTDPTRGFADSLAAGAWAAERATPLLLTATRGLSSQTRDALVADLPAGVDIVGGQAAVSAQVETDLTGLGIQTVRHGGDSRAGTAVEVAVARGFTGPRRAEVVIIADGEAADGWADGFAGAGLAAAWDAPILLSAGGVLPPETQAFLTDHAPDATIVCAADPAPCAEAHALVTTG